MKSSLLTTGLLLLAAITANGEQPSLKSEQPVTSGKAPVVNTSKNGKEQDKKDEQKKADEAYNPIGKRDPFTSFVVELQKVSVGSHSHPLQKFQLAQLKLIGVVVGIPHPKAMFEDPSGKAWIVGNGTHVGKNFGKIKQITKEHIVVVEEHHDPSGGLTLNEVVVKLYQGSGDEVTEKKEEKDQYDGGYTTPVLEGAPVPDYGSAPTSPYESSAYETSEFDPINSDTSNSYTPSQSGSSSNSSSGSYAEPKLIKMPKRDSGAFGHSSDNIASPTIGGGN